MRLKWSYIYTHTQTQTHTQTHTHSLTPSLSTCRGPEQDKAFFFLREGEKAQRLQITGQKKKSKIKLFFETQTCSYFFEREKGRSVCK